MIKLKSPREIALMREAGRVVAKALDQVRRIAVPGATTADMDEAVAADLPRTPGHAAVPGLSQLDQGKASVPRSDLREHQRAGRARHPQPPAASRRRHRFDRHRLPGQWLVRRRRGHPGHRNAEPRNPEASRSTSETLDLAIRAMGRCQTWSEVASLMERFVKSQGFYVVEKFVGHGIGQNMHEEPQVPNFVSQALRQHRHQARAGRGAGHRAHGRAGNQGSSHAGRRMDHRHQGPASQCPFRAHGRDDPRWPARSDFFERRRCDPGAIGTVAVESDSRRSEFT